MYLKNGLAEKKEGEREGGKGGGGKGKKGKIQSIRGKARKWGGTHFEAHAYLSQQPNKAGPQRKKKFSFFEYSGSHL